MIDIWLIDFLLVTTSNSQWLIIGTGKAEKTLSS